MKFIKTSLVSSAIIAVHLMGCPKQQNNGPRRQLGGGGSRLQPDVKTKSELEESARELGRSAQSFDVISAGIKQFGVDDAEQAQLLKIAIQAALDKDQIGNVAHDMPAPEDDIESMYVAEQIKEILEMKVQDMGTTNAVVANCPPESVTINKNHVKFSRYTEQENGDKLSDDVNFIWTQKQRNKDELIQAQIAQIPGGANFVELVLLPRGRVEGISEECLEVSTLKKSMEPLAFYPKHSMFLTWNMERSLENVIQLGIHALKAFEAIHQAGVVFGRSEIHRYIKLKDARNPDWTDPGVLAIDGFRGVSEVYYDPSLSLLEITSNSKPEYANGLNKDWSPGQIRGYSSSRIDDLYRLSETLFNACGSYLYQKQGQVDYILAKKNWILSRATIKELAQKEGRKRGPKDDAYLEVLNAFHQEMFELSYSRSMDKPDYQTWINRFQESLGQ